MTPRNQTRRLLVGCFAVVQLAIGLTAPVADALVHARTPASSAVGSPQPAESGHDPFTCAICQHVERSRSVVAHPQQLLTSSPGNTIAQPIVCASAVVGPRTQRPHSRDPPTA
jgi:hypothetical protein